MPIPNNPILLTNGLRHAVYQSAEIKNPELVVLLHGWTGDENSMWVFARDLPRHYAILSPRGALPASPAGYSWILHEDGKKPDFNQFAASAGLLLGQINRWIEEFSLQPRPIHWIGFSQGAALALTLSTLYPNITGKTAVLSGFIPVGGNQVLENKDLSGSEFFISHGIQDEIVPVSRAREAARILEKAHANVTYCEENVGHKTGSQGFKALRQFYTK